MSEELGPSSGVVAAVIARHEGDLLRRANVVAVAERQGEPGITVYVTRKVPRKQLPEGDVLPSELEGIPVEVVESGRIDAQNL